MMAELIKTCPTCGFKRTNPWNEYCVQPQVVDHIGDDGGPGIRLDFAYNHCAGRFWAEREDEE